MRQRLSCDIKKSFLATEIQKGTLIKVFLLNEKADLFLFCACVLRLVGDESALCENMARAIFLPGQGDCPAVIASLEMFVSKGKSSNVNPVYEETFRKQLKSDFCAKSYPLRLVQVVYSPANRIPRNVYFLNAHMGISDSNPMYWLPFFEEARWVVVLRPFMDERRKLIHIDEYDQARFKGIEAYSFIDHNNLMTVPLPQQDWAICTQWSPKNKVSISPTACAPEAFEDDVKTMADAFYGKNIPLAEASVRLSKMLPDLKTPLGQRIARTGLTLLERADGRKSPAQSSLTPASPAP